MKNKVYQSKIGFANHIYDNIGL